MLQSSFNWLFQAWWLGIFPGACIALVALGYVLLAGGIEQAFSGAARPGRRRRRGCASAPGGSACRRRARRRVTWREHRGPAPAAEPVLEIEDLVVDFPTERAVVRAVDGVRLTVHPGQRIGIVGESGSGKSTLAMAALGLLDEPGRISHGSVRCGDVDLRHAERAPRCAPSAAGASA